MVYIELKNHGIESYVMEILATVRTRSEKQIDVARKIGFGGIMYLDLSFKKKKLIPIV